MELNRNSLFISYAYSVEQKLHKRSVPDETDVCSLFWRAFFLIPVLWVGVAIIMILGSPFFLFAWLWSKLPKYRKDKIHNTLYRLIQAPVPLRVAARWFRDLKDRTCTIVKIK